MIEQQQHPVRHWAHPYLIAGMGWEWLSWWIVGLWRAVTGVGRWVTKPEALEWVTSLAAGNHSSYVSASKGYKSGKRGRVFAVVCAVIALWWLSAVVRGMGGYVPVVALAGFTVAAAAIGHRCHRPAQAAAVEAQEEGPTREQERVAEALAGRLSGVRDPDMLRVSPIRREWTDVGTIGRSFTVGLPLWIEAAQVAQNRAVIAAALNTRTDRITVTEGTSPNQAVVFVADISPSEMPAASWPLVDATSFDLTQAIPIGQTPDGRPASLQLFSRDGRGDLQGHHVLLTGMSGYGKSTLLQLILTAAALDPRAVLNVTVLKDTRDFEDIAPALSYLGVDSTIEDLRAMLDRAVAHMGTKAGVPYVVVIDECQEALGAKGGDSEAREKVRTLLAAGRSAGIAVVLVTQEPTGPNLEPDLARRPQNRISFWQSQNETADRAMGSGMTEATNPSKFGAGDFGLAAVIGVNGFRGRVKTPMLDPDLVARIAQDHRRETEPEFPTYAEMPADLDVQDPAPDSVADLIARAWPKHLAPADRVSRERLADLLPELDPRFDGITEDGVRDELRAVGVQIKPLRKLDPANPDRQVRGVLLADLTAVVDGGVTP